MVWDKSKLYLDGDNRFWETREQHDKWVADGADYDKTWTYGFYRGVRDDGSFARIQAPRPYTPPREMPLPPITLKTLIKKVLSLIRRR